ncbi:MAG: hypothetical protein ACW97A_02525 [Candidatus Thorarchaeota archaeon]
MAKDDSLSRLLRASKKRTKELEEDSQIKEIASAIGDRRIRDLVDITARVEQDSGWECVLEYLIKAAKTKYPAPIGAGGSRTSIEPLKYREMVFTLFGCAGFEPVGPSTINLLRELEEVESTASASQVLTSRVEELLHEQIRLGDTLFFDFSTHMYNISRKMQESLERVRQEETLAVSLSENNGQININPLWHIELGRRALVELGMEGQFLDHNNFELVLSVIQVSSSTKKRLKSSIMETSIESANLIRPSNKEFESLLNLIISQDLNGLRECGSRYSFPVVNTLLDRSVMKYKNDASSDNYRYLLSCINAHVVIRTLDSILSLKKLMQLKDIRLVTPASMALGNFYHESSAAALLEILCNKKDKKMLEAAVTALDNLYIRTPEAEAILVETMALQCKNPGLLKRIYKRLSKKKSSYYKSYE